MRNRCGVLEILKLNKSILGIRVFYSDCLWLVEVGVDTLFGRCYVILGI